MTQPRPFNLGIIARADDTGLGNQTRNLVKMLKPNKVLVIDSTPFNGNEQHFDWYDSFNMDKVWGFPSLKQLQSWMQDLTHVLTVESFYSDYFVNRAMRLGIKTYCQMNFEFADSMVKPMTPPTKYFMPSYWKLEEVQAKFPNTVYLPPPLFENDFKTTREANFKRTGNRFLHIVGKYASKDRNGTESLLNALAYTNKEFEIVVKSQGELPHTSDDDRVKFEYRNIADYTELYKDFDAMILPRRYGGLCLPMMEALMSGLPVIMTDISPNNKILPEEWLVKSRAKDKLLTRMVLDVYDADPIDLASKIEEFCTDLEWHKAQAFEIAMQFSASKLKKKYIEEMF